MKYAADFRRIARKALTGKWGMAVIAGVIATLLGAIDADALKLKLDVDFSNADVVLLYFLFLHFIFLQNGLKQALFT